MDMSAAATRLGALALGLHDRQVAAFNGLDDSKPAALLSFLRAKDLSVSDLEAAVGLSQSATVRLVDRLEAEGLVRRAAKVKRVVRVSLTSAGRREAEKLAAARIAALEAVIARLEPVERDALGWLLDRLLGALEAEGHDPRLLYRWGAVSQS
jgi:DNA-binding MarR family transcriptional regulator